MFVLITVLPFVIVLCMLALNGIRFLRMSYMQLFCTAVIGLGAKILVPKKVIL